MQPPRDPPSSDSNLSQEWLASFLTDMPFGTNLHCGLTILLPKGLTTPHLLLGQDRQWPAEKQVCGTINLSITFQGNKSD
jgi:hypothetical protein